MDYINHGIQYAAPDGTFVIAVEVQPGTKKPEDDFSTIKSVWDFIGRWFPNPVEPGLRSIASRIEILLLFLPAIFILQSGALKNH